MKIIFKKIKFAIALPIIFLVNKLPKKNIIVFESFLGSRLDDNIFNIINTFPNKKKYIVYSNMNHFKILQNTPNIYFIKRRTVKYYLYLAIAKYIISNSRLHAGLLFKSKSQTVIQLWHGIPWKKLAYDQVNKMFGFQTKEEYLEKFSKDVNKWDYLWVPSKMAKVRLSQAFKFNAKFIEAMYPADVELLKMGKSSNDNNFENTVLYMPTFREDKIIEAGNYKYYQNFDFNSLCLNNPNTLFLVRTHYLISNSIDFNLNNIVKVEDDALLNELYSKSDILITDYSSAIFHFSLLNKPIIAICTDFEEYKNNRGLYDDAVDNMNLNIIYNDSELEEINFSNLKNSNNNQEYYDSNYEEILHTIIK